MQNSPLMNNAPRARAISTLKKWISNGKLKQDEALPSERVLCSQLNVTRQTCRRAILALQEEGLITRVGPKTRIIAGAPSTANKLLSTTVVVFTEYAHVAPDHLMQGWSDSLTSGAMQGVTKQGLHALHFNPDQLHEKQLEQIALGSPFGAIIPELDGHRMPPQRLLEFLRSRSIPIAVYGNIPDLATYDRVASDHETGTYELTKWLISKGRTRILPFWSNSDSVYWVKARRIGYERAMHEAGLEPLPLVVFPQFPRIDKIEQEDLIDQTAHFYAGYLAPILMKHPIDAVELVTDGLAPTTILALKLLGKRVHEDVTVVGYDNYWSDTWESHFEQTPPAATVDKQNVRIGHELVKVLMERVEGKLPDEPQCRVVPQKLIIHED